MLDQSPTSISVSIPVADSLPNREEMASRNAIMDDLDASGFGNFVGAGGGFNQMDFQYEVLDVELARQQLTEAMEKHLPGKEYEITVG